MFVLDDKQCKEFWDLKDLHALFEFMRSPPGCNTVSDRCSTLRKIVSKYGDRISIKPEGKVTKFDIPRKFQVRLNAEYYGAQLTTDFGSFTVGLHVIDGSGL